jgi:hypothetical protein
MMLHAARIGAKIGGLAETGIFRRRHDRLKVLRNDEPI